MTDDLVELDRILITPELMERVTNALKAWASEDLLVAQGEGVGTSSLEVAPGASYAFTGTRILEYVLLEREGLPHGARAFVLIFDSLEARLLEWRDAPSFFPGVTLLGVPSDGGSRAQECDIHFEVLRLLVKQLTPFFPRR